MDFDSASSPKQQFADIYFTSTRHIILTHSQPIFVLTSLYCKLSREAAYNNFIFFGLTCQGIKSELGYHPSSIWYKVTWHTLMWDMNVNIWVIVKYRELTTIVDGCCKNNTMSRCPITKVTSDRQMYTPFMSGI